jgi:hypothetical protein
MERRASYPGHDKESAIMTATILKRLKMPNDMTDDVCEIVGSHMKAHEAHLMNKKIARKFLSMPLIEELMDLVEADEKATKPSIPDDERSVTFRSFVTEFRANIPLALPDKIVKGIDLINAGFKPGEGFKDALQAAFDAQLEGEDDKAVLLQIAIGSMT